MTLADPTPEQLALVQDEAVRITRDLIRIDSSNFGGHDLATWGPGERAAAGYVVDQIEEVGLAPEIIEYAPGRANVVVRISGEDRERGGLVIHGHLDVVPAIAEDWSVDPFAADVVDGELYGRGAVDMKGMDGIILAVVATSPAPGRSRPATWSSSFSRTRSPLAPTAPAG